MPDSVRAKVENSILRLQSLFGGEFPVPGIEDVTRGKKCWGFHTRGLEAFLTFHDNGIKTEWQNDLWTITLTANMRAHFRLEHKNLANSKGTSTDLRQTPEYRFKPDAEISDFEILVGEPDIIKQALSSLLPREFNLGQNYPNPFNPTTTFSVTIPVETKITLKIFNVLGERVRCIYRGTLPAGQHQFSWNAKNDAGLAMPSGVYIYRLQTRDGLGRTGKMILLK